MPNFRSLESLRRRVCTIIDIGTADDLISRAYDIFYTLVILVNLVVTIAYTFDEAEAACGPLLLRIEAATVAFFAVDCVLRIFSLSPFPERRRAGCSGPPCPSGRRCGSFAGGRNWPPGSRRS